MKLVYCKKDYDFFEKGMTYYMREIEYISGMTYTRGYLIFDSSYRHDKSLNKNIQVGEIGYLYDEVFEDLETHRERLLNDLLGKY